MLPHAMPFAKPQQTLSISYFMTAIPVIIVCNHEAYMAAAQSLALKTQLTLLQFVNPAELSEPDFVVLFDAQGIAIQHTGRKAPGPIRAEFTSGAVDHRRKFGGGKGQLIAKAVGVKAGVYPSVMDVTAGLGRDAFVLATLGCEVQMLERSAIVYHLLDDGLTRAREHAGFEDAELAQIIARMKLIAVNSLEHLAQLPETEKPDVIYLDPMFPDREKSAEVKKEMAAFHQLVGKDEDAAALLTAALDSAIFRVVVKRPRKAEFLGGKTPSYQLEGKSSRYDIYTLKKLPDQLKRSL